MKELIKKYVSTTAVVFMYMTFVWAVVIKIVAPIDFAAFQKACSVCRYPDALSISFLAQLAFISMSVALIRCVFLSHYIISKMSVVLRVTLAEITAVALLMCCVQKFKWINLQNSTVRISFTIGCIVGLIIGSVLNLVREKKRNRLMNEALHLLQEREEVK